METAPLLLGGKAVRFLSDSLLSLRTRARTLYTYSPLPLCYHNEKCWELFYGFTLKFFHPVCNSPFQFF